MEPNGILFNIFVFIGSWILTIVILPFKIIHWAYLQIVMTKEQKDLAKMIWDAAKEHDRKRY